MSPPFSKIFSKEISRWQTPWRWRKATACKSCQDHNKMSSFVGWLDEITLKRSPPSAYSSTNQISSLCWKATNISKMYSGIFSPCCRYPKTPISAKGSSESLALRSNNNSRSLAGLCRFTWTRATGSFLAGDFNPSHKKLVKLDHVISFPKNNGENKIEKKNSSNHNLVSLPPPSLFCFLRPFDEVQSDLLHGNTSSTVCLGPRMVMFF